MAKCPNCGQQLHLWNLKAECPKCHENIPNHNWEENLEIDAVAREKAFYKMHTSLNMLKFSVVGTPLRIARLALAFLPILGYVVPLGSINLTTSGGQLVSADTINAIQFFTNDNFKIMDLFKLITADGAPKSALLSLGALVLSLLFGVIAFFLIPILFRHPKQPVSAVFHVFSIAAYATAPFMFNKMITGIPGAEGSVSWGTFVGLALFVIALIVDMVLLFIPLKDADGKYIPDANKDLLQAEYAESIGMPFIALKEVKENTLGEGKEEN